MKWVLFVANNICRENIWGDIYAYTRIYMQVWRRDYFYALSDLRHF